MPELVQGSCCAVQVPSLGCSIKALILGNVERSFHTVLQRKNGNRKNSVRKWE
jgi:hypothetical protein